jgi:CRISPR-associated protein Cas2
MRVLVFFDLPTETPIDKKNYRRFHEFLLKEGFMMLQFSVYTKLAINKTVVAQIRHRLEMNKPPVGNIATLEITEKQYAGIKWILGERENTILNTTNKLTIYEE